MKNRSKLFMLLLPIFITSSLIGMNEIICPYSPERDKESIDVIIEKYPQYLYTQSQGKPIENPSKYFTSENTDVLRINNKTIGFINTEIFINPYIKFMGIDESEQGKGYGKKLIESAISKLRSRGVYRIFLSVKTDNTLARTLYEKIGFKCKDTSARTQTMLYKLEITDNMEIQNNSTAWLYNSKISLGLATLLGFGLIKLIWNKF